jgi:hypothetical protein
MERVGQSVLRYYVLGERRIPKSRMQDIRRIKEYSEYTHLIITVCPASGLLFGDSLGESNILIIPAICKG